MMFTKVWCEISKYNPENLLFDIVVIYLKII